MRLIRKLKRLTAKKMDSDDENVRIKFNNDKFDPDEGATGKSIEKAFMNKKLSFPDTEAALITERDSVGSDLIEEDL